MVILSMKRNGIMPGEGTTPDLYMPILSDLV